MKTTYRIAKNELRTLFYSPIAWFLVVVFLFDYGLFYTLAVSGVKTQQEVGGPMLRFLKNVTNNVLGEGGLFGQMLSRGFLYVPLLTMGLMSRETASGTIKLLYSSPIKVRQIVFGKFMAMMLFSLIMILMLSIFVVCGLFNIVHADAGPLLAGLFSVYLLMCTFSAIGLFMSSLTTYQVVAAVSTLVMLAFLSLVGNLWQDIDFIRDLTFFLSLSGRASHMMKGLLTTKDIFYFVLISGMFLVLTIYKLKAERETRPFWQRWGRYGGVVLATLMLGYVLSRPGLVGYLDTTTTQSQTLSLQGKEILKEMKDGPLEVTTYINLLDPLYKLGRPQIRNVDLARYEMYQRFKSDMKFNYVYYYDSSSNHYLFAEGKPMKEIAEKQARTYRVSLDRFETPEEIHQQIDLTPEMNRFVVQMKYGGKSTFLRAFDDMQSYPSEKEVLAAMKRLVVTPPKIAFVTGQLERNINQAGDRQYKVLTNQKTFRASLINQGFDIVSISLRDQEIPAEIAGLVLADPATQLDTAVLRKLERYIAAGGNLLIAGEPGRQDILNPLLKPLGVQLMDGILVQQSTQYSPDLVQGQLVSAGKGFSKNLQQDAADSLVVSLTGAVGLSFERKGAFDIQPLIVTDSKSSWSKKKKFNPDMVSKIEAPYASQEAPMSLTAVSTIGDDNAKAKGSADLNRIRAGVKVEIPHAVGPIPGSNGVGQPTGTTGKVTGTGARTATSAGGATSTAGTAGTGTEQSTGVPQKPRVVTMNMTGTRSLQEIVDSLRKVNNGKMPEAASTASATTSARKASSATTASVATASSAMTLTPTERHAGRTDSVDAGRVGPAHVGNAGKVAPVYTGNTRMPMVAGKAKGMMPVKGFAFPAPKAAQSMPARQTGQASSDDGKPVDLAFSAADGDIRGTLPVALSLTRHINDKEQRIIVVGDADFLSNAELSRQNLGNCNFDFATSVFGWFSYGKFPVDIVRPEPQDNRVSVSDRGLTIMKVIFMGILPALAAVLGSILLLRRRRK